MILQRKKVIKQKLIFVTYTSSSGSVVLIPSALRSPNRLHRSSPLLRKKMQPSLKYFVNFIIAVLAQSSRTDNRQDRLYVVRPRSSATCAQLQPHYFGSMFHNIRSEVMLGRLSKCPFLGKSGRHLLVQSVSVDPERTWIN